jgi:CIC family chloride channel protein
MSDTSTVAADLSTATGGRDFLAATQEVRRIGLPFLSGLAFVVGIVTGLGAVLFRDLIGLVHNLLFVGQFAVRYDANVFTPPSP